MLPPLGPAPAALRSSTMAIDPGGSSRSGCSFSQPRLITITSPPKFGFRLMLRSVRMGTIASGASMATPQPYVWSSATTSLTLGNLGSSSLLMRWTAYAVTPATHWTVWVIARMLRVPTEPSGFR